MGKTKKRVMISAALRNEPLSEFNSQLAEMIRELSFDVYLPQEELPRGSLAAEVFTRNTDEAKECKIMVTSFNEGGLGVAFEVAVVYMSRATIVGATIVGLHRRKTHFDGLKYKARSQEELKTVLVGLR